MKKTVIALCLAAIAAPAHAMTLLEENWTGASIANGLTISGSPLNNLGAWIDFPDAANAWDITSGAECVAPCQGSYARQNFEVNPSSDNTNMLFYGIDYAVSAGDAFEVSLDYVASNRNGSVFLLGLTAGGTVLDPFAPFWPSDTDDGVQLLAEVTLDRTNDWTSVSRSATATAAYDALAFAVVMGGPYNGTELRGVDNVLVTSVPEPTILGLMAIGLAGIGFARSKKAE